VLLKVMNVLFMYRGENRLVGWEYRPVANVENRCLLRMIVSTDIKVSARHKAFIILHNFFVVCIYNIHMQAYTSGC